MHWYIGCVFSVLITFNHSYIVPVQKQYEPGAKCVCLCEWKIKYDIPQHSNKSFALNGVPKLCFAFSLNIEGIDLVSRT